MKKIFVKDIFNNIDMSKLLSFNICNDFFVDPYERPSERKRLHRTKTGVELHHVTGTENLGSIQRRGLIPLHHMGDQGYTSARKAVYAHPTKEGAEMWLRQINVAMDMEDKPKEQEDYAIISFKVPRKKLRTFVSDEDTEFNPRKTRRKHWKEIVESESVAYPNVVHPRMFSNITYGKDVSHVCNRCGEEIGVGEPSKFIMFENKKIYYHPECSVRQFK